MTFFDTCDPADWPSQTTLHHSALLMLLVDKGIIDMKEYSTVKARLTHVLDQERAAAEDATKPPVSD